MHFKQVYFIVNFCKVLYFILSIFIMYWFLYICVEVFKEVFIMYNVNFGTEQQQPIVKFPATTAPYRVPTQTETVDTFIPSTSTSQMQLQNNDSLIVSSDDSFNTDIKPAANPLSGQAGNMQQRPNIMLLPINRQMAMRHQEKKFDWDNFYRIAGLTTSIVLTILIGLSLKPMIGRYFKKSSSDLFKNYKDDATIIDFDKLPGMNDAKKKFIEKVLNPIADKEMYLAEGVEPSLFCILHGPPGTGKTNFVLSAAKKVNAEVAEFRMSEIGSKYMNETSNDMQAKANAIMAHAKKHPDQEYFVVFDEIESMLTEIKKVDSGADQDRQSVIKTFLQIFDGLKKFKNIKIFATTNMTLDKNTGVIGNMNSAAMSRLGTKIFIGNPDKEGIAAALKLYLNKYPSAKELANNDAAIAELTNALENSSYRDITYIIDDALDKMMTLKRNAKKAKKDPNSVKLTKETFMEAIRDFEKNNKKLGKNSTQSPSNQENVPLSPKDFIDLLNELQGKFAEGNIINIKPENIKPENITPNELEKAKQKLDKILNDKSDTFMNKLKKPNLEG